MLDGAQHCGAMELEETSRDCVCVSPRGSVGHPQYIPGRELRGFSRSLCDCCCGNFGLAISSLLFYKAMQLLAYHLPLTILVLGFISDNDKLQVQPEAGDTGTWFLATALLLSCCFLLASLSSDIEVNQSQSWK